MGSICSRDDNVDNQAGNANATVGENQQKRPETIRQAAPSNEGPSPDKPTQGIPKSIASSQVEDMHADAKQYEPYSKMHQLNAAVQRRLDSMVALRAESQPALRAKYSSMPQGTQVVRNTKNASTYQGQMQKGVPHGFGRLVTADGSLMEGFFSEGNPDGFIRRITSPHAAVYEGEFKVGLANGKGMQIDERDIVTECSNWVNGQPSGQTVIKNSQGKVIFQGNLSNDKKSGDCVWYDEKEKATITGNFQEDRIHGKGKKVYDSGQIYEGEFSKGLEQGNGSLTFVDGRKFVGPFSNGKANGAGTLFTDSGKGVKQTWKDGKRV